MTHMSYTFRECSECTDLQKNGHVIKMSNPLAAFLEFLENSQSQVGPVLAFQSSHCKCMLQERSLPLLSVSCY